MQTKLHIKVGDTVRVMTGKSKGKEGKVLSINREKLRAIVEGTNMMTKHLKPNANNPQGSIEKKEAPIHVSNLMVLDPKTNEPTRVGRKLVDGKNVRYSKKSGEEIK